MKKIITSVVAAGLVLGSTVSAVAAPASIDRDPAVSADSEEFRGRSGWLIVLLFAAIAAGVIFLIEDNEDDEDFPTSP